MMAAKVMAESGNNLAEYFASVRGLQSDDPLVRRPAISALLELARRAKGAVRLHAEQALIQEFGPYAVTDGLGGCAGPIEAVRACYGEGLECRSCPWVWLEQEIAWAPVREASGTGGG